MRRARGRVLRVVVVPVMMEMVDAVEALRHADAERVEHRERSIQRLADEERIVDEIVRDTLLEVRADEEDRSGAERECPRQRKGRRLDRRRRDDSDLRNRKRNENSVFPRVGEDSHGILRPLCE